MTYMTIERAARHAWPSIEEKELPYGILRFAHGYTKRANSMTVYSGNRLIGHELVQECEDFFGSRQQPAIIRMPSLYSMVRLDNYLDECGYQVADPSRVMIKKLVDYCEPRLHVLQLDRMTWLDAFCEITGASLEQRVKHEHLLRTISGRSFFACFENEVGDPACCAVGIFFNGVLGIFNLATSPESRRRQFATLIVNSLLAWGRENQATHAFLQVSESNSGAIRFYEKLGFKTFYRYRYRVKNGGISIEERVKREYAGD